MNEEDYGRYQQEKMLAHEALCKRCGVCCGAGTDPCAELKTDDLGRYYCGSYDTRLGQHLTVSGNKFTCVSIREVLTFAPPSIDCGYSERGV